MKRIYIPYSFLIVISIIFCFAGCVNSGSPKKKYCGISMKFDEILYVRKKEKDFRYSDNDMNVQGEIAYFAQKIGGDSIIIEVFFILSNEKELGIDLNGPNDPKIIEALTCAIINGKYENKVPPMKYVLYYNDKDNSLLSAIRSPKKSEAN
jgi:hypothetical protein